MAYEQIIYEVADGVATITLNRPEKLNAFTGTMMAEMIAAFDATDADDDVRCVIVTGAGRAFCAGADLSGGGKTFDYESRGEESPVGPNGELRYSSESARDGGGRLTLRIFESVKPVIAAINGPAVGVGSTMTLPMDIRLASDTARMGFVFARRGIVPEAASSYFLPRVVGISQALEWCYSGRVFDAAEAHAGGLVKEVLPADRLLARANELAREIADNTAPVSVALTRAMLWRGLGYSHPMDAHKVDSRAILSRGRSGDAKEGVTSFLEKRAPVYPDRVSRDMPDFVPWWEEQRYS
ncbi:MULTISPECIES: crotonase/enoyl-CoA hydratase family protein [Sphingomonas]|uniref:Enoyl-CoA hydratase n=1 Tax=Sphingomonas ginsenosidimutans TaxID=862134 RepID=A0A2A4I1C2_9SPHN|nr:MULTISPECIES: crotonase/enoyl-CoA hydratase family protein [Sphingomonas]MBY0302258.1 crotonase/enoyl-CoA hydratase family protein [Sphingomonas ginsenosidimutans]PCG09735.1 enoyl-CoA hydratase [Sphingomonas ginsenosidimutans]